MRLALLCRALYPVRQEDASTTGGNLKKTQLTVQELKFIKNSLRKALVGRTEADRLWEIISKIERIIDEQKHDKSA